MTLARPRGTAPNGIFSYHAPLPATFPVTPGLLLPTSTPLLAGPILLLRLLLGPRPRLGAALGTAGNTSAHNRAERTSTTGQQAPAKTRVAGRILKSPCG